MGAEFESPEYSGPAVGTQMPYMQQPFPQGLPVGTGALGDCGCGPVPTQMPVTNQVPTPTYVPTTPPVYSAPYTAPVNVAQPPFMNPYGMGPGESPYSMPRYQDESNEYSG
jgi:hypothetical protein